MVDPLGLARKLDETTYIPVELEHDEVDATVWEGGCLVCARTQSSLIMQQRWFGSWTRRTFSWDIRYAVE
jgi:hypothetical protein